MANVQWLEIPFHLISQYGGDVHFNPILGTTPGPQWLLDADKCQAGSAKRVTRDNSPQTGGEIVHRHFKTGFVMQIGAIAVNVLDASSPGSGNMEPCCGSDLVDLSDGLMRCLDGMENIDGSLNWVPSGYPKTIDGPPSTVQDGRSMFGARWLGPDGLGGAAFTAVLEERDTTFFTAVQFALVCPYPYATDTNEVDTDITDGGGAVDIDQGGSTEFWPVIEVYGPSTGFTITCVNAPNGTQNLIYDSTLPGALPIDVGDHIEFNFFTNTAYFNGSGGNAKAGIDVANSDFWSLVANTPSGPVTNAISIVGADATVKWKPAWV